MKFGCLLELKWFPFDTQLCEIKMESFMYNQDYLHLHWKDSLEHTPVEVDPSVIGHLPGYRFSTYMSTNCSSVYHSRQGEFSCIKAYLRFQRRRGHYLLHVYIPTTAVVMVSWLTFYVKVEMAPARVGLGVTTLLTIVSINYSLNRGFPPVSYPKAVDVWNFICFFFIFLTLLEYVIAAVGIHA